ncbi:DNA topology modulation protein [Peribacillus sp. SCS-155]|uniref:DNA topology modulation protein n=1 Tax=Peribacillus sedimenti TaxID=3115297 RepID=UPI0039065424
MTRAEVAPIRKILIMGCSGSGKSTLAKRLADRLHIKAIHLDSHYWKPGWVETPRDEWIGMQLEFLREDAWIIDGNYTATIEKRLQEADTVIYLDFPTLRCLYGIVKRRIQYIGRTRPDMAEGCPEKIDWEFFQYVRTFNRRKAPALKERLLNAKGKNIFIFKTRKQVEEFLGTL